MSCLLFLLISDATIVVRLLDPSDLVTFLPFFNHTIGPQILNFLPMIKFTSITIYFLEVYAVCGFWFLHSMMRNSQRSSEKEACSRFMIPSSMCMLWTKTVSDGSVADIIIDIMIFTSSCNLIKFHLCEFCLKDWIQDRFFSQINRFGLI